MTVTAAASDLVIARPWGRTNAAHQTALRRIHFAGNPDDVAAMRHTFSLPNPAVE